MESTYPNYQNFLLAVFGKNHDLLPLRDQDIETIHREIERYLKPREVEAIKMRFGLGENGKKHTFQQIGAKFGKHPERARQIYTKAVRNMCHPLKCREIRWLFRETLERDFAKARDELAKARLENDKLKGWDILAKNLRLNTNLDASITDLNLSIRPFNCLYNLGIRTVGDLVKLREDQLSGLRNFGAISMKEVKDKLAQLGLQLTKTM